MNLAMTIPLWVMLGFAGWTLAVLMGSIGIYRWSRILTGRATIAEWRADTTQGNEWYQRAMRAHMNCVENLPVYGAVALAAALAGVGGRELDTLALAFLAARVGQSLVHIALPQTETVAALRFGLYFAQVVCVVSMGVLVALRA
jgi:uncharacterized MAPEG superfamily protein